MSALLFPTQQLRCSGFEGIISARNIKGTPKVLTNVKDKYYTSPYFNLKSILLRRQSHNPNSYN